METVKRCPVSKENGHICVHLSTSAQFSVLLQLWIRLTLLRIVWMLKMHLTGLNYDRDQMMREVFVLRSRKLTYKASLCGGGPARCA